MWVPTVSSCALIETCLPSGLVISTTHAPAWLAIILIKTSLCVGFGKRVANSGSPVSESEYSSATSAAFLRPEPPAGTMLKVSDNDDPGVPEALAFGYGVAVTA